MESGVVEPSRFGALSCSSYDRRHAGERAEEVAERSAKAAMTAHVASSAVPARQRYVHVGEDRAPDAVGPLLATGESLVRVF
jgi:hypothetical protein